MLLTFGDASRDEAAPLGPGPGGATSTEGRGTCRQRQHKRGVAVPAAEAEKRFRAGIAHLASGSLRCAGDKPEGEHNRDPDSPAGRTARGERGTALDSGGRRLMPSQLRRDGR